MKIVLISLLIIAAIYLAVCAFYYFFQEKLIFVPAFMDNDNVNFDIASDFQEFNIKGSDDAHLNAILIKAKRPKGCILYFHGNTGTIKRWAAIAEELTSFGFDVFLPDYRGYGKSKGLRTERTLYEDAVLWYNKVLEIYSENKVCIYGRSLGSSMACWLAAHGNPGAIVLETPFYNLIEQAAYHSRIIPVRFFLRYHFRNEQHLKQGSAPVLIAHGTKDKLVPYKSGLKLYKTVKDRAEMLTIPGGKHGNLNGFPIMRDTLGKFLAKHFKDELPPL